MKRTMYAFALLLCFVFAPPLWAANLSEQVESAFRQVKALKDMEPGQKYTVSVRGQRETGVKEEFLRRRSSDEILSSGLSCGCGDYAISFLRLMEKQGVQARLVDGAQVSTSSLADHFSGHAVVAVRAPGQSDWWLTNPTDQTILSKHWSLQAHSFQAFDSEFWIGYCGSLAAYPVHNGDELKRFYTRTLGQVPLAFLNQHIYGLHFVVDPSLQDGKGGYKNPNLSSFLTLQSQILNTYHVHPLHQATVRLVCGKEDDQSYLEPSLNGQWRGVIGLKSGCSAYLLTYFEQLVRSSSNNPNRV